MPNDGWFQVVKRDTLHFVKLSFLGALLSEQNKTLYDVISHSAGSWLVVFIYFIDQTMDQKDGQQKNTYQNQNNY